MVRPGAWLLAFVLIAAPGLAEQFVIEPDPDEDKFHPRHEGDAYCFNERNLASSDDEGLLQVTKCEGWCENGECQEPTCDDGLKNQDETGVDCGGSCSSQCLDCVSPKEGYFSVAAPTKTSEQEGFRLLQLADDEVFIRSYDTLYEHALQEDIPVERLDEPDVIMEAVASYVDEHMTWKSDGGHNPYCINNVSNANYDPGWDFPIPADYTIDYTAAPGCDCGNDYCGDCEDHAILRQALAKRIGIDSACIHNALDLQRPGLHEYNLAYYQGKFRIMDYGELGRDFNTRNNAHQTQDGWNYASGKRGDHSSNDVNQTQNYPGSFSCPTSSYNFTTYYTGVCP